MLAIIGLSRSTVPFIEAAQSADIEIVGFDKDPTSAGRMMADHYYSIDARDFDQILQITQEHYCEGCFTYSSDNDVLWTSAKINFELNKSMQVQSMKNTLNKRSMKSRLEQSELPTPDYIILNDRKSAESFLKEHGKIVVKPVDGTGGHGVRVTEKYEERSKGLLAEPYLEGQVYTVDGFVSNGKWRLLAVSRKTMVQSKGRFIMRGFKTVDFGEGFTKAGLAGAVVEAFEIDDSFFSIDIIASEDGLEIIDVGLLLDAKMDRLLHHMDFDVYSIGIQLAMGEDIDASERELFNPGFEMRFIYPPNSKVLSSIARWDIYDPSGKMIARET